MISGTVNYLFSHIYLILEPENMLFSFALPTDLKATICMKESLFYVVQIAHGLLLPNPEFFSFLFLTFAILFSSTSNSYCLILV